MKSTVIHTMKLDPELWPLIESGDKKFEIRSEVPDNFQRGDYIRFVHPETLTCFGYRRVATWPLRLKDVAPALVQQIAGITEEQYARFFPGAYVTMETAYIFQVEKFDKKTVAPTTDPILQIMKGE
jgi:hypothetical protein